MSRPLRLFGPAALLAGALCAVAVGLAIGGGAAPLSVRDPGTVVRWGGPMLAAIVVAAASTLLGALVLAAYALPREHSAQQSALDVAASAAGVLTIAAAAGGVFSFLLVAGKAATGADFGAQLGQFVTGIALGQSWLAVTLIAAAMTVCCLAVRQPWGVAILCLAALACLVLLAAQGHGSVVGHTVQLGGDIVHLIAVGVWVGGLVVLTLIGRRLTSEDELTSVVRRYSTLALLSFVAVGISGTAMAVLQVGSWANLVSGYGAVLIGKVVALVLLGGYGWAQRRVCIGAIAQGRRRWFWGFVLAELVVLGAAAGLGVALARTAPPAGVPAATGTPTPAELLTGRPLPPTPEPIRFLTEWQVDSVWLVGCVFAIGWYLLGVWRLRRRGIRWSWLRTVSWVFGCLVLAWLTSGALNVYQEVLFSAHMVDHMGLTMVIPVFLVLGAPVTLLLRAVPARADGSLGAREWVLRVVHARITRALGHPLVAAALFAGSLFVFYYTPLFRWATTNHLGHQWMLVHFLLSGYLFVSAMVGVDPGPRRWPAPLRLVLLLGTMAFHAFFGLSIMMGNGLLLADWYGAMGWGTDALADQRLGGGLAWSIGELPTVTLAVAVAVQWTRTDERESRRRDRHADRTGEAELVEYNARLAALAERDRSGRREN